MELRSLVVDDEPVAAHGIEDYVQRVPFLRHVATCHSALEALTTLKSEHVDLVFLDIHMPEMTGLQMARSLDRKPMLIFTTAYREYAAEGFEVEAVDYLVKPISFERFLKAANRAAEIFEKRMPAPEIGDEYVFIKVDGKYVKVKLKDIFYFEADRDYVYVHTREKRYMILLPLKHIEAKLPSSFLRIHRSFIINSEFVAAIGDHQVRINDRMLPISRNLQDKVYRQLIQGRLWKK